MSTAIVCREATKADLPAVLQLYAQPDLDDGQMLPLAEAERIFERDGYSFRTVMPRAHAIEGEREDA